MMSFKECADLLSGYKEALRTLEVNVKISVHQAAEVTVKNLIPKRNHQNEMGNEEAVEHFDYVLRYYLTKEEFERYVINKEEL